jgi:hypothetical protein
MGRRTRTEQREGMGGRRRGRQSHLTVIRSALGRVEPVSTGRDPARLRALTPTGPPCRAAGARATQSAAGRRRPAAFHPAPTTWAGLHRTRARRGGCWPAAAFCYCCCCCGGGGSRRRSTSCVGGGGGGARQWQRQRWNALATGGGSGCPGLRLVRLRWLRAAVFSS